VIGLYGEQLAGLVKLETVAGIYTLVYLAVEELARMRRTYLHEHGALVKDGCTRAEQAQSEA
jgi:hypothetical protein